MGFAGLGLGSLTGIEATLSLGGVLYEARRRVGRARKARRGRRVRVSIVRVGADELRAGERWW